MKDRQAFIAGLFNGLAPPAVFETSRYPNLSDSDMARMRRDVERVGEQFSAVIDRENGKAPQSASPKARDK